jgi:hypothetical protein
MVSGRKMVASAIFLAYDNLSWLISIANDFIRRVTIERNLFNSLSWISEPIKSSTLRPDWPNETWDNFTVLSNWVSSHGHHGMQIFHIICFEIENSPLYKMNKNLLLILQMSRPFFKMFCLRWCVYPYTPVSTMICLWTLLLNATKKCTDR